MENSYTNQAIQSIVDANILEDDVLNMDTAQDYLSDSNNFRSFTEGLSTLLERYGYTGAQEEEAKADFLLARLKEIGVTIAKSTVRNWFSGIHAPKIDAGSRERMYQICFSLGASKVDTEWFFQHVYYDRSFNIHRLEEAVYYFCFSHGLGYAVVQNALAALANAPMHELPTQHTPIYTISIRNTIDSFDCIEALTDYLKENKAIFCTWNQSVTQAIWHLMKHLQPQAEAEALIKTLKEKHPKNKAYQQKPPLSQRRSLGLVLRELCADCEDSGDFDTISDVLKGKNVFSRDFVLSNILSSPYGISKHRPLSYHLKNNFPSKKIFSDVLTQEKADASSSYDAFRKVLILLKFYEFFAKGTYYNCKARTAT